MFRQLANQVTGKLGLIVDEELNGFISKFGRSSDEVKNTNHDEVQGR